MNGCFHNLILNINPDSVCFLTSNKKGLEIIKNLSYTMYHNIYYNNNNNNKNNKNNNNNTEHMYCCEFI